LIDETADATKRVTGYGMPSVRYHNPGDLYLSIKVAFPDTIPPEACPALQALLPPPRPLPTWGDNMLVDEVTMIDASDAKTKSRGHDDMDEDEEGGGSGQPHVQWYVLQNSLVSFLDLQTDRCPLAILVPNNDECLVILTSYWHIGSSSLLSHLVPCVMVSM
jgi:hypothetical protein